MSPNTEGESKDALLLSRRAFVAATAMGLAPGIARALQPSSPSLVVTLVDNWAEVQTTTGRFLVGELLLRNTGSTPVELAELRLQAELTAPLIGRVDATGILARLANASTSVPAASVTIAPNDAALLFVWERLDSAAKIRTASLDLKTSELLGGVVVPVSSPSSEPVVIEPPLAGGPWVGVYDPHSPRSHRRVAFSFGDRLVIPARFAIDWIRLDDSGRPTDAAPNDFARWYGFGADVLAVADATVVAVRDSYPDVLTSERPQKRSEDDVSGNYVGLTLASGRFAFYEHLQQGSVRVKVGDTVAVGQPIARLGRSGINSAGPHLHFHVGTDPSTLESQGRPFVLSEFRVLGNYPSMGAALGGTRWSSDARSSPSRVARNMLPAANAVVMFDRA